MKTKKNLIKALKKLVTSFGGEAKSNNAVDLVDEFADVAAQGSGGGGVTPLTLTLNNDENHTWSGATWEELIAAWQSGRKIILSLTINGEKGEVTFQMIVTCYFANSKRPTLFSAINTNPNIDFNAAIVGLTETEWYSAGIDSWGSN